MLLQNQAVFSSPIEALLRTTLMMFDLGYEDRLYGDEPVYYKLVYVMMFLTAIVFCIFIINLLIGKMIFSFAVLNFTVSVPSETFSRTS
jgi:hypothetical protein